MPRPKMQDKLKSLWNNIPEALMISGSRPLAAITDQTV